MSFWLRLDDAGSAPALWQEHDSEPLSYRELQQYVDRFREQLPAETGHVALLGAGNDVDSVVAYLAALQAGHALILVRPDTDLQALQNVLSAYQPAWMVMPAATQPGPGWHALPAPLNNASLWLAAAPSDFRAHPDLALCLSTSGSSGSPKLVRLSHTALAANARSIADYLNLTSGDRAITSLPMSYSYGLSVINSHLAARASLLLSERSLLERPFWDSLQRFAITSLAGVPYSWQMMLRAGLEKMALPHIRTLTQAGGRLDLNLMQRLQALAQERDWEFFVMYGQTEATARISYVPPARLAHKWGSIGVAIPGGELAIDPDSGELLYRGPNVMLGYANEQQDLALGDELQGLLRTGDLARVDEDGYLYLTGRRSRLIKMQGNRYNLDEIEAALEQALQTPLAAVGQEDVLYVHVQGDDHALPARVKAVLREKFRLHPSVVQVRPHQQLPMTANGKTDYLCLGLTDPPHD